MHTCHLKKSIAVAVGGEKKGKERERGREIERLLFFLRLFACFLEVSCTRLSDGFDVLGIGTVAGSLDAVFGLKPNEENVSRERNWSFVVKCCGQLKEDE